MGNICCTVKNEQNENYQKVQVNQQFYSSTSANSNHNQSKNFSSINQNVNNQNKYDNNDKINDNTNENNNNIYDKSNNNSNKDKINSNINDKIDDNNKTSNNTITNNDNKMNENNKNTIIVPNTITRDGTVKVLSTSKVIQGSETDKFPFLPVPTQKSKESEYQFTKLKDGLGGPYTMMDKNNLGNFTLKSTDSGGLKFKKDFQKKY